MNDLQILNYDGANVEVIVLNDEVLFNAKDVASVLEIKNVRDAVSKFSDKQKVKVTNDMLNSDVALTDIRNSKVGLTDIRKLHNTGETFLTERGVYKLVFKSRKPEAEKFQDWVCDEVLPSIRQTGSYMTREQQLQLQLFDADPLTVAAAHRELVGIAVGVAVDEATAPLVETIETQKPLVTFAEHLSSSDDNVLIREMAKIASQAGYAIGQKRLYEKLREWGFIFKNSPEAKQVGIDRGFFIIEERAVTTPHRTKLTLTTKVTPQGQVYIVNRLLKELED